jgi:hypothetical protein
MTPKEAFRTNDRNEGKPVDLVVLFGRRQVLDMMQSIRGGTRLLWLLAIERCNSFLLLSP